MGWFMRIFPSFAFGYGVLNVGNRATWSVLDGRDPDDPYKAIDMKVAGGDILFLGLGGFVYSYKKFLN